MKLPWWVWVIVLLIGGSLGAYGGFFYNGIGGAILGFLGGGGLTLALVMTAIAYWPLTIVLAIIVSSIALLWNVGVPRR
jgi:hypothetical protein